MDGSKIVTHIQELLKKLPIETYNNVVYNIIHDNAEEKAALKLLLNQGNSSESHTVVTIDFLNRECFPDNVKTALDFPSNGEIPRIRVYNSTMFIYGEYIKQSRNMTQTPLKIKGVLKTERSVSDFTKEFETYYKSGPINFIGCGREDLDVFCVEGRPFLLEIPAPCKNLNKTSIPIGLYREIDIKNVYVVKKDYKKVIVSDVSSKTYTMDIFSERPIEFEKTYHLVQRTPLRVLHRRANLERERTIEIQNINEYFKDGYYYELTVKADSGTYIKEWVRGDFGRTVPNLNSDILRLDVLRVEKEFKEELVLWKMNLEKYIIS